MGLYKFAVDSDQIYFAPSDGIYRKAELDRIIQEGHGAVEELDTNHETDITASVPPGYSFGKEKVLLTPTSDNTGVVRYRRPAGTGNNPLTHVTVSPETMAIFEAPIQDQNGRKAIKVILFQA